jgi:hypothetical protein
MTRLPGEAGRLALLALVVVAGFGAIGWTWLGSSTETIAAQQVAWIASGALTGGGLIAVGSVLGSLYWRRRNLAAELLALEIAARDAREIAALLRARKRVG